MNNLEIESPAQATDRQASSSRMASGSTKCIVVAVLVAVGLVVGLLLILLPLSFKPLDYYEFGFRRRETTGTVDMNKVYAGGLHLIGPDYAFKKFKATAHFLRFDRVEVFAADRLQVQITARLQYFLRQHQLVWLHENYDIQYEAILSNNALDAIKGAATVFETRRFIHERQVVEEHLFKVIRERLGGTCCEERDCPQGICKRGCTPIDECQPADAGLFVDVRYFQLHELEIPDELNQRFLESLVLGESNIRAQQYQEALIIRKETDALAKQIENQAKEISQNATALSVLAVARAEAEATAMIEKARSEGLRHLYSELRLNTQESKLAYDYLRTLRQQGGINLAINYNQHVSIGRSPT